MGSSVYCPYPRRHEIVFICRCNFISSNTPVSRYFGTAVQKRHLYRLNVDSERISMCFALLSMAFFRASIKFINILHWIEIKSVQMRPLSNCTAVLRWCETKRIWDKGAYPPDPIRSSSRIASFKNLFPIPCPSRIFPTQNHHLRPQTSNALLLLHFPTMLVIFVSRRSGQSRSV